jgi:hypothetical protein
MKYLRSALRRSKPRKPLSLSPQDPTVKDASPRCSSVLSDCDADDESSLSSDLPTSRSVSLSIPIGLYCPRRPTLREVLADESPSPWTLGAFMAYLSQNHCLETLEFTIDATRYTTHYRKMLEIDPQTPLSPQTQDCEYVKMLWRKLLDAYVVPNAPREVNLPSNVRDRLISRPCIDTPPDAAELEPAAKIIYELMNESVLGPFLNAVALRAVEHLSSPWTSDKSMIDTYMFGSLDERSLSPTLSRSPGKASPPVSRTCVATRSSSGLSTRPSPHSRPTVALCRTSCFPHSAPLSSPSATSTAPDAPVSSDDSTDSLSSALALDPMTPPH